MKYRFLVEFTKTENTAFPSKNALSEVNSKTEEYNMDLSLRMVSCQLPTLIARKFCFS